MTGLSSSTSISAPYPRKYRSRVKSSKRKRSSIDDDDPDYDDLEIDMDDAGKLTSAQKRSNKANRIREIEHMKQTTTFKAITSYDSDGARSYLDSKEDLADVCPDLWERIQIRHEAWERARGEEWRYDLESKYTVSSLAKAGARPVCVSTKLLKISGGKVDWREGCEGMFACKGCVREKWPCFGWDGEELYLLPLHEKDRTWPKVEGFEIRTWLDVE